MSVNQITRRETAVHTVVKEYLSKFYPNHSLPGPNQCETITDKIWLFNFCLHLNFLSKYKLSATKLIVIKITIIPNSQGTMAW